MNAFAGAVDAAFNDPNIGNDAQWRSLETGGVVFVRIIMKTPQDDVTLGGPTYALDGIVLDVRQSDVIPAEGDLVDLLDDLGAIVTTWKVQSLHALDRIRLVQTVWVAPIDEETL